MFNVFREFICEFFATMFLLLNSLITKCMHSISVGSIKINY